MCKVDHWSVTDMLLIYYIKLKFNVSYYSLLVSIDANIEILLSINSRSKWTCELTGFLLQEKRNIAFMQELRCLFALMVGSNRRFVDPSAAVELLRDAFRTSEAQQVHHLNDLIHSCQGLILKWNSCKWYTNKRYLQMFTIHMQFIKLSELLLNRDCAVFLENSVYFKIAYSRMSVNSHTSCLTG